MTPIRSTVRGAALATLMATGLILPSESSGQAAELEALVPQELEGYTLESVDREADARIEVTYHAEEDGERPVHMTLAYGGDGQGLHEWFQAVLEVKDLDTQEIEVGERTFVGFKDGTDFIVMGQIQGFTVAVGYTEVDAEAAPEKLASSVSDFLEAFEPSRVAEADPPGDMEVADEPDAAGATVCEDMLCFAQRVSECQEAEVRTGLGPRVSVTFEVEGEVGQGCRISSRFDANPNPELEGEPLFFVLPEGTAWREEVVQEIMEGCLGENEETLETYQCEGALLEVVEAGALGGGSCGAEQVEVVEGALGVEFETVRHHAGFSTMGGEGFSREGCSFQTAEEARYRVAEVTQNALAFWESLVEQSTPEPGWQEGLEATGLEERVDRLVVEDDELIVQIEDTTWFFEFGTFGDDPDDGDRRGMVEVADDLVGMPVADPDALCREWRPAVDAVFGVEEAPQLMRGGGGRTEDGERAYEYSACRFEELGSELQIAIGRGDKATFEGRRPLRGPPELIDSEVGDGVLVFRDRLVVRDGDRVLVFDGRDEEGDIDPRQLLPLADAVVSQGV